MLKKLITNIIGGTKKVIGAQRISSGEFLLQRTDFGLIRVEFAVVQKIVEYELEKISELQDISIDVEQSSTQAVPFDVSINLTLLEGCSVPQITAIIDKVINAALQKSLQLGVHIPIKVKVQQIVPASEQKRKRVR